MSTIAGTKSKSMTVTPLPNTVLYNNVQVPTPTDLKLILAPLKPHPGQNYFLFPYFINRKIESPDDPYVAMYPIAAFETKEEAKTKMRELAAITKMNTWAIAKANQPFTFELNPPKDNCGEIFIVGNSVEPSYQKIEQQWYDDQISEYERMVKSENRRAEYSKKLVDTDSYEYFELFMNTYLASQKDLEEERKRLKEMEDAVNWRKSQIDGCVSKHPEFMERYNGKN